MLPTASWYFAPESLAEPRLGHRLTIAMTRWQALVNWSGTDPVAGELVAEVDSFEVMRGEGGVKAVRSLRKLWCGRTR